MRAVVVHNLGLLLSTKELCIGIVHVSSPRPSCTLPRRTQQPQFGKLIGARVDTNRGVGVPLRQSPSHEGQSFIDQSIDRLRIDRCPLVERASRNHVTAGSTSQSHVDASGEQGGKSEELFCHLQAALVHGHHTTRTNADARGPVQKVGHHQLRGRGHKYRCVVVLCDPEAMEIQFF